MLHFSYVKLHNIVEDVRLEGFTQKTKYSIILTCVQDRPALQKYLFLFYVFYVHLLGPPDTAIQNVRTWLPPATPKSTSKAKKTNSAGAIWTGNQRYVIITIALGSLHLMSDKRTISVTDTT